MDIASRAGFDESVRTGCCSRSVKYSLSD